MDPSRTEHAYRARVARAVAAIVADPPAEHRLEDLAQLAHFSPFHFPASGYEPDDRPMLEQYLSSAREVAPDQLRTDLMVPIRETRTP